MGGGIPPAFHLENLKLLLQIDVFPLSLSISRLQALGYQFTPHTQQHQIYKIIMVLNISLFCTGSVKLQQVLWGGSRENWSQPKSIIKINKPGFLDARQGLVCLKAKSDWIGCGWQGSFRVCVNSEVVGFIQASVRDCKHSSVPVCQRASVRACQRASVRASEHE